MLSMNFSTSAQASVQAALTREEAQARFKQVKQVAYKLDLTLGEVEPEFQGKVVITFELRPNAKDHGKKIALDFEEGTIHSITVNHKPLLPVKPDKPITAEELKPIYDG